MGERTDTERGAPVRSGIFIDGRFSPWAGTLFVWLAVAMTVAPLALLALHTVLQRRGRARRGAAAGAGADACCTGATERREPAT